VTALALAVFRDWRQRPGLGLFWLLPLCLLATSFRVLSPFTGALAAVLAHLVGGWLAGWRYGPESAGRQRLRQALERLPSSNIVLGLLTGAALAWAVFALVYSPVLVLVLRAWQLPASILPRLLALGLATWLLAGAAGFLASATRNDDDSLPGLWLTLLWFLSVSLVPVLRFLNPFIGAWWLMSGRHSWLAWLALPVWLAVAGLLALLGCGQSRRLYRKEAP